MATPDLSKLKIDRAASPADKQPESRRRRLMLVIAGSALAIAAVAAFSLLGGSQPVETTTVALAYRSQNVTLLNATGYAVAQRKAAVSSKGTGRLEWLGVLEGSRVKKDEIIARLESRDVAASLSQAVANVKVAQANLEQGQAELLDAQNALKRSQELLSQKFISAASHDATVARYHKAKAAISGFHAAIAAAQANQQVAQVALDQTVIRAPFDGIILTKAANVGDNITPYSSATDSKGAVVTMADMKTLEVEADVSESSLHKIKIDQPCEIQLDALPDLRLSGVVSRMVPTVDRSKATLLVKVRFTETDPRVLPDMSAKVAFLSKAVSPEEKAPLVAVQPAAIAERSGKKVLFIVKDGALTQIEVIVGEKVGELVAVEGVKAGDKVVLNPSGKLKDGSAVTLAKK